MPGLRAFDRHGQFEQTTEGRRGVLALTHGQLLASTDGFRCNTGRSATHALPCVCGCACALSPLGNYPNPPYSPLTVLGLTLQGENQ